VDRAIEAVEAALRRFGAPVYVRRAIEAIAPQAQLVLVVGDPMSSNARRLVEVAVASGCPKAVLVEDGAGLPWEMICQCDVIGLTAAASTPETALRGVCEALDEAGFALEEFDGTVEHVRFRPVSLDPLEPAGDSRSTEDRLAELRRDLDALLEETIGSVKDGDRRLAEAMRYAVIGGGKRFRALLVASVCDLVGGSYGQALRVGAAIECIHAQSLVHDDLPCMDDDDLRRGRPTLHRKFDEATAVLAGDALLALAFELLAGCCQSNANLSPANIAGAGDANPQAARLLHSANAAERRSL
jgi:hypothetical protein